MLTLEAIQKRSTEAQGRKQRFQAWQSPTWEDVDFLLSRLAQVEKEREYWRERATEADKATEKWYRERY